eukprot:CAMPEP_0172319408 /NCGR_PEP_ID=MMETSP1058-20130122/37559_1 /TAXON_ID=83371 /ORGANISM="Detonula confervacea, Strain CCMP 353" /LENGTH=122 /DNA_ID=CAMNT_0013034437 /DNA_START=8 /DNA_END=373 /DNA_ORIENTATION=-
MSAKELKSSDLPSRNGPRDVNNESGRTKPNSEHNFTSAIELSTRRISKIDPAVLLAEIQTQPQAPSRSQLSSAVSPETKASTSIDGLAGEKSTSEREDYVCDERTAALDGTENSASNHSQHE